MPQNCTLADLASRRPNPHVARGALIEQSSFSDTLPLQRATNGSHIAPEDNAGFVGAHAFTFPCPRLVQRQPDGGRWRAGRTSQQHDVGTWR